MLNNNFEDEEFDEEEYFREMEREDWLENTKEGRRWNMLEEALSPTVDNLEKIRALKQKGKKYTEEEMFLLLEEFQKLKTYEDKLNFFEEKEMNLLNVGYFLREKKISSSGAYYFEKGIEVILIRPESDIEKNMYLTRLTEWINIVNEEDKDKSYQTLIDDYNRLKLSDGEKIKKIEIEINIAENSIENIMNKYNVKREGMVNFLSMYEDKKNVNLLGLWKDHYLGIFQIQVIAYEVSKVIGFVRYKEFLKGELEKLKVKIEFEKNAQIEKDKEENPIISRNRTFKRKGIYKNDIILKELCNKLIEKGYIEDITFENFVKVFDYQPIKIGVKELESKIIWKIEYKTTNKGKKTYDWAELLTLIEYITDIENRDYIYDNRDIIRDIIMCCFEFDDGSMIKKREDIFDRIKAFKERKKKKTKIEKLIDELNPFFRGLIFL